MITSINKYIFLLVLLVTSNIYSQKIKITTHNKGVLIKNNEEITGYTEVDKILDKGKYVIGIKKGFMPQALEVDELFRKNLSGYTFTLLPIATPILSKSLKSISFISFVDPSNITGMHLTEFRGYGGIFGAISKNIELKDPKLSKEMNLFLIEKGFKVFMEKDNVFEEKTKPINLAIGAEILSYMKDTRYTDGFRTSTVLKWSVYDISEQKVVFNLLTGGYANEDRKVTESEVFILAAQDAIQEFINHPEFIKLVSRDDSYLSGSKNLFNKISIPAVLAPSTNENHIEASVKSTLIIKSGNSFGAGFIISSNGYLLTNAHVISDSSFSEAVFASGLTLPLQLVRMDLKTDVALLKVVGKGHKPLPMDTLNPSLGSDIIAIGTPKDIVYGQTISKGVVSAMREFENQKYIQIDASINGGNSGGPLINNKGQVIGIVSRKRYDAEGIGFAIPIQVALKTLNIELKNNQ